MTDSWYSDAALAKQAKASELQAAGERVPVSLLAGLYEPRVHPSESERCAAHRLDARPEAGGDGRFCGLCIGRGYDEDES